MLDLREDNQVVWARRFDRAADDPLAMQEEISGEVAAQIDPVMLLIEAKRGAAYASTATSAYGSILRSIPLITRLERTGFLLAGQHLEQAIAMEPDNSAAHAWYASWHLLLVSQGWADEPDKAGARATELAERAIVLDPFSAEAFAVAGQARTFIDRRPRAALTLHERALELNPNLAPAWAMSAITHVFLGEPREAEQRYHRYKTLSPLDPCSFKFEGLFASLHLLKHDHHAAATIGRAVTQLNPAYSAGYKPYLAALGHLGLAPEAEIILRRLLAIEPGITMERCLRAFPLARREDQEHFAAGLRLAGLA